MFYKYVVAIRHKAELGLSVTYRDNAEVRRWFRRLVALCMLPVHLVIPVGTDILTQIPPAQYQFEMQALQRFATYFRNFWMRPNFLAIWNQFRNEGPRTTNHAEGFHNGLRTRFARIHPDLGEFLCEAQVWNNSYSVRARQLFVGAVNPNPRKHEDVDRDRRISNIKMMYNDRLHNQIDQEDVFAYLDAMQWLLGNHQ